MKKVPKRYLYSRFHVKIWSRVAAKVWNSYKYDQYGEEITGKRGELMDWKKIRQAVRTVLAAVLICAASVGITGDPAYAADMGAVYGIYEHGTGWSGYHGDSKTARAGTGSYVTAIRASLLGQPEGMSGTLSYQVNLSGSGWLSWQENMTPNGSTETDMPLEAVRMAFTGQLAENYDVYYSVYQNGSWTTPVKNGETAGTEGQGLRVDGLWVTVTGKGAEVPVLIGGFAMGPAQAALIAIVKNLLKLLLNGTSTYYVGELGNIIGSCMFSVPAALIYRRHKRKRPLWSLSLPVSSVLSSALYS